MLNRLLPVLFAALVGPLCLFLALTVPLGEVPDEPAHAMRADSVRHAEVLGHRVRLADASGNVTTLAGVDANRALLTAAFVFQPQPLEQKTLTRERRLALQLVPWDATPAFAAVPNTAVYLPVFYVPAAIGLAVAQAAGSGPFQALLAARALNAVAFVLLGTLALVVARAGRLMIFVTLSLPMTVWLAGSVNPDGLLVATACLAAASLTRLSAGRRWPGWMAGGCLALLGMSKPCYLPLALAMLARLRWRSGPALWRQGLAVVAVTVPGLLWAALAMALVAVPFGRLPYSGGPLWPGDPGRIFTGTDVGAQLAVLADRPSRVLTLTAGWLDAQGRHNVFSTIGVLGLLDLLLPLRWYFAWMAGVGVAAAAELFGPWRTDGVRPLGAAAMVAGVLASFEAVLMLQYLNWTSVGLTEIDGVQGRYFLPLLPFLGVAASAARLGHRPVLQTAAAVLPVLLVAGDAVLIARLVMMTYYLR